MSAPRILLAAGEPSGDLHGAGVARALRRRWPDASLYGLGGPLMAEAGVDLIAHVDQLAVMGLAEVATRVPSFYRLLRKLRRRMAVDPPDLVIPIDYPGFNLRLAQAAKARNVPVLYYIAPQVWAWHRSRARKLARYTDRMAVILPFEERLFRAAGARAKFVGHPLLDVEPAPRPREEFCRSVGVDPERPIVALFPGSRPQELERHLSIFTEAMRLLVRKHDQIQPVIAVGPGLPEAAYESSGYARTADSWELLRHATAALVKSGTSTLQAALTITPMVVAYRMHPLTFGVARRVVRVEHVALANLVASERIATELLQEAVTPNALAVALEPLLDPDSDARRRAEHGLARVRGALTVADDGARSVADRVAGMAAELLAVGTAVE